MELPLPAHGPDLSRRRRARRGAFFGFGLSDKPIDDAWYTFARHRDALVAFVERLDLTRLTLVARDWRGLLGLTLPPDMPGRFERLLVMNTALATGHLAPRGAREPGSPAEPATCPVYADPEALLPENVAWIARILRRAQPAPSPPTP